MRPRRWRLLLLIAGLAALTFAPQAWRWLHGDETERQAHTWQTQAEAAVAAGWTEADAERWLQAEGFGSVFQGISRKQTAGAPAETIAFVQGWRALTPLGGSRPPTWLRLAFLFDRDGHYRRVETEVSQQPPHR